MVSTNLLQDLGKHHRQALKLIVIDKQIIASS